MNNLLKRFINIIVTLWKHYTQKIKVLLLFYKLSDEEKMRLKYANIYEIVEKIEKEFLAFKDSYEQTSKNQSKYLIRHFINFFEYIELLTIAKNYKYLLDFRLAKYQYHNNNLSYRYEKSLLLLKKQLKKFRIKGYKEELINLYMVYNNNFVCTDGVVEILELILKNIKEEMLNEINNRFG